MVADGAGITILDTSAGIWATQSAQASAADEAALPEWAKRRAPHELSGFRVFRG